MRLTAPLLAAALGALPLSIDVASAQSCAPTISIKGQPCIGQTFTVCATAGPDCNIFVLGSPFGAGPVEVLGITLLVTPEVFMLLSGGSGPVGDPVCHDFPLPLDPNLIGFRIWYHGALGIDPLFVSVDLGDHGFIEFCAAPNSGEIGGTVFHDLDGDGVQGGMEVGLAAARVRLSQASGPVQEMLTDAGGAYRFTGLPANDECTLTIDPVSVAADKVPGNCATVHEITLTPAQVVLGADFCYQTCGACNGRVTSLTMRNDGAAGAIRVRQRDGNRVVFDGPVGSGEIFAFAGLNADGTFGNDVYIDRDGTQVQQIKVSCSEPIGPGMAFGDFAVVSGRSRTGGPLCRTTECRGGSKPCSLQLRYDGRSCAASFTSQPNDKWSCSGDPASAASVIVKASDKSSPTTATSHVYFDGPVALGEVFQITAAAGNQSRFPSSVWVHVLDASTRALLQSVKFDTSCSQPLVLGDRWGSIQLTGVTLEGSCN